MVSIYQYKINQYAMALISYCFEAPRPQLCKRLPMAFVYLCLSFILVDRHVGCVPGRGEPVKVEAI